MRKPGMLKCLSYVYMFKPSSGFFWGMASEKGTYPLCGEQAHLAALSEIVVKKEKRKAVSFKWVCGEWLGSWFLSPDGKRLTFISSGAGNIARTYTEECVGILTELLGLQQEHITSGNCPQAVFLAYAFSKRPCWGLWSWTRGSERHLTYNLIGIFRWKSSWWSGGV